VIINADARTLPLDDNSVDTILCDPPYGLSFMGKAWDHGVPGPEFWIEALRVAKPGCWLMAFGGTRTWHRLAVAIEDSGWEIRDTLSWNYGSGFPKSLDISKAIDKAAGAEREVIPGPVVYGDGHIQRNQTARNQSGRYGLSMRDGKDPDPKATAPATESAQLWDGYGTALKPAWEPIILARAPLDGTNANNALTHGCGGLWIDGGRVEGAKGAPASLSDSGGLGWSTGGDMDRKSKQNGRWPANVILDPEAGALLDRQSGELKSGALLPGHRQGEGMLGKIGGDKITGSYGGDSGGASRFFYCAKPSKAERNAGLDTIEAQRRDPSRNADQPSMHGGDGNPYNRGAKPVRNSHPTVKPVSLLRHLLRLTKPPGGGVVLDNFCGSGSTGIAAVLEGRGFIGTDISPEYCEIARARIEHARTHPWDYDPEQPKPKRPDVLPGQISMFDIPDDSR
jgi:site-specific DNA-methyltransferase (adenine-specific)